MTPLRGWECESCRSYRALPGERISRPYGALIGVSAGKRIFHPYGAWNARAAGQTGRCPVREYFAPTGLGLGSRLGVPGRARLIRPSLQPDPRPQWSNNPSCRLPYPSACWQLRPLQRPQQLSQPFLHQDAQAS